MSNSYKKRLADYRIVRDEYMAKHEICQVCDRAKAEDLHHRKSRIGKMLTDVTYFLAVCRPCHERIHRDDLWARENGYLLSKFN